MTPSEEFGLGPLQGRGSLCGKGDGGGDLIPDTCARGNRQFQAWDAGGMARRGPRGCVAGADRGRGEGGPGMALGSGRKGASLPPAKIIMAVTVVMGPVWL